MIVQNLLPDGMRLPSTRKLAEDLGINRSTIVAAYNELSAEELVESYVGEGTSVSRKKLDLGKQTEVLPIDWSRYYSISSKSIYDSTIKEAMALSSHKEVISFASGIPAPEFFPTKEFQRIGEDQMG